MTVILPPKNKFPLIVMKATTLFVLLFLPFFGFSQVDLATWSFTSNSTTSQPYITATSTTSQITSSYGANGLLYSNGDGGYQTYRYLELSIAVSSGNAVKVSSLDFSHSRISNGGNQGISNYRVKYFISSDGTFDEANATTLVNDEAVTASPNKSISINKYVGASQKLIVRFYSRGGSWEANAGWLFQANSMKFKGVAISALSGTYFINSSQTPNFPTISEAIKVINSVGVTAPVVLLLDNNTINTSTGENFPITITNFAGSSSTNTLTIKPNSSKTPTISGSNADLISVFKIEGGDNIFFDGSNSVNGISKDLTIEHNGINNSVDRSIFWIANKDSNTATNIKVSNIKMKFGTRNQEPKVLSGVFLGSHTQLNLGTTATAANSNIEVSNNSFLNVRQGIYMSGSSIIGLRTNDVKLSNNLIGSTINAEKPAVGIQLVNIDNFNILDNNISGLALNSNAGYETIGGIFIDGANNFSIKNNILSDISFNQNNAGVLYGMQVKGLINNGKISENILSNIKNVATNNVRGLHIKLDGSSSSNLQIHNNSISDISGSGSYGFVPGIYLESGNAVKLNYNTVVLSGAANDISAPLYIGGGSNLDVRNNIFVNNQTSGTRYALYSQVAPSAFTSLNYNNYRAETLSNITYGINTTSISPLFISGSSYKLQDVPANNPLKTGTPIATITTDIENVTRNTTSPTMGAFEISCVIPAISESFGNNEWNGYIFTYTEGNTNFATATYIGTLKEDKIFDRNVVAEAVNGKPGSLNIPSCITAPKDRFMIRYKMKLTISAAEAGIQNFTITGDDGYRLTVDGDLIINKWNDNSGTAANLKNLAEGQHELVLEYFEKAGDSKIEFSYGKIKTPANNSITLPFATNDVNLPYGINQWNAYGFSTQYAANNNFGLNPDSYAGYYVQTAMAPNTELIWNEDNAPSTTLAPNTWNGAPTHKDNFTLVYKRQGFKCGRYTLKMDKWDDAVTVFIDGVEVAGWAKNSWSGDFPSDEAKTIKTITLNANSKIEIRLKDRGSKGSMRMSLNEAPLIYNGSNLNDISNTSMTISENRNVSGQMNVCSCTVPDGKILTIKSGAILNVAEDITVIGTGKIVVENTGSLVQINNDATYTGSNSSFVLNRETTPVTRYDFTYWSSPLKTESNFILGRELPSSTGTARKGLSPQTFFDKYYLYSGQAWVAINYGAQVMVPARGYIVRAPQTYSITEAAAYNAVFEGKPNNGVIKIDVDGTNGGSNLIGNPYPSAINAQRFYDANSNLFDGTFYFWTHKAPIAQVSGGMYQYSAANYISLNQTGSTANAPTSVGEGIAGKKASVNIAAGQAFFVNTKAGLTSGQQFTFNNSMRVKEENKNSDFFRMAADENTLEDVAPAIERNRIWVNVTNATGAYNEALIGYVSGATDGYDNAFDGVTYASGTAIYTMLEGKKLVIQGKSLPFEDTDVVPLGFSAATAGEYSIGLESFDGLFSAQNVYLVDKTDNSYHNIKVARYTFTSAAGTFNSRFEIRYTDDTNLGVDTPAVQDNDIVVYNSGSQIGIRATNFTLDTVQVYDITGKLLFSGKNINNSEFTTSGINVGRQMVVVKITLDGNQTLSKKVMMR